MDVLDSFWTNVTFCIGLYYSYLDKLDLIKYLTSENIKTYFKNNGEYIQNKMKYLVIHNILKFTLLQEQFF
jgi:hypothetical protein